MKHKNYLSLILCIAVYFVIQPVLMAKYIAVVDSGSTSSAVYLFDINTDKEGNISYRFISLKNNRNAPGLAHILPEDVEEYFSPIIKSLRNGIPGKVSESDIDFYVLATGDMRAVSPYVQKKIFSSLKKYLSENTKLNVIYAQTMPEKMEGVYDWMCINMFEHKIGTKDTYGVIDIGGSTIQVAYAVDKLSENTQKVKIGPFSYFVHSRSYLGIGNDQAREQFLDNPSCIPRGLSLVTTTGDGNYKDCLKAVRSLLVDVHKVEPIPREILKKMKFIGFSYFYYLVSSPPFALGDKASINDIKAKAENFAKLSWDEMLQKWPDDKYLHAYYLGSALVVTLFEILGFSPDTKIIADELYGGRGDSWALGAAVFFYCGNKIQ